MARVEGYPDGYAEALLAEVNDIQGQHARTIDLAESIRLQKAEILAQTSANPDVVWILLHTLGQVERQIAVRHQEDSQSLPPRVLAPMEVPSLDEGANVVPLRVSIENFTDAMHLAAQGCGEEIEYWVEGVYGSIGPDGDPEAISAALTETWRGQVLGTPTS